jgi:hypothetical protein
VKIQNGDFIAVYLWAAGAHAFHNAQHVESVGPAETIDAFITKWMANARSNGASFRFDAFVLEDRAFRENDLDDARGELTAAILDDEAGAFAFENFRQATRDAYGMPR